MSSYQGYTASNSVLLSQFLENESYLTSQEVASFVAELFFAVKFCYFILLQIFILFQNHVSKRTIFQMFVNLR